MTDLLGSSAYFGLLLSLGAYGLGLLLQRRWKLPIFNPLLVAIVVVAVVLLLLDLDYGSYSQGANLLNYLLTPATVCLAVPLYEQFSLLRRHGKAVLLGIAAGVAIGTSTHAVGTARAMEMGEIQGAMSSLSIVVAGLLTVVGANLFAHFL